MRKFWLEAVGENAYINLNGGRAIHSYGLMEEGRAQLDTVSTKVVLTDVSGLGYEKNNDYAYAAPFGHLLINSASAQTAVAGTLNFKGGAVGAYNTYNAFTNYCEGRKMRLRYAPLGGSFDSSYCLDGEITKLLKTEISASRLPCGFEFRGVSSWYNELSESYTISGSTTDVAIASRQKVSNYLNSYTFTLTMTSSTNYLMLQIEKGNEPAVAQIMIMTSLAIGDIVVWSNDPDNPRVTINGADATQYITLNQKNYAAFAGQGYSFWCIGGKANVVAEYKRYYRSV